MNKQKRSYWNSLSICIPLLVSMCQRCECLSHRGLIGFTCTHKLSYKDEKGAKHTTSFLLLQVCTWQNPLCHIALQQPSAATLYSKRYKKSLDEGRNYFCIGLPEFFFSNRTCKHQRDYAQTQALMCKCSYV